MLLLSFIIQDIDYDYIRSHSKNKIIEWNTLKMKKCIDETKKLIEGGQANKKKIL